MEPTDINQGIQTFALIANLVILGVVVSIFASMWQILAKAGIPGWHALVPVFGAIQLCRVAGKSGWFALLLVIPLANIYASFAVSMGLAKNYGKGAGFGIGLFVLPIPFYMILAFSSSLYVGPNQNGPTNPESGRRTLNGPADNAQNTSGPAPVIGGAPVAILSGANPVPPSSSPSHTQKAA